MKKIMLLVLILVLWASCKEPDDFEGNVEPIDDDIVSMQFVIHGTNDNKGIIIEEYLIVQCDIEVIDPNSETTNGTWTIDQPVDLFFTNDISGGYQFVITQTDESNHQTVETQTQNLLTGYHYVGDIMLGGTMVVNIED